MQQTFIKTCATCLAASKLDATDCALCKGSLTFSRLELLAENSARQQDRIRNISQLNSSLPAPALLAQTPVPVPAPVLPGSTPDPVSVPVLSVAGQKKKTVHGFYHKKNEVSPLTGPIWKHHRVRSSFFIINNLQRPLGCLLRSNLRSISLDIEKVGSLLEAAQIEVIVSSSIGLVKEYVCTFPSFRFTFSD